MALLRLRTLEMCLQEASALNIVSAVLLCAHPHGETTEMLLSILASHERLLC